MRCPDPVEQAFPFDPTTAARQAVDAERSRERRIRTDQATRITRELDRLGYKDAARVAGLVEVEPGW